MGRRAPGIYVEILIREPLETVWRLTQAPELHQRWDLRFTRIEYLPRPDMTEPQKFLYETRIGFGLAIRGTGESVATRAGDGGDTTSSLKFASEDWKSLIRTGAGYWRYVPTAEGLRFFTWYDYEVRFGWVGRTVDALAFRPLMGWATAWSFDRMRWWAEDGQTPEASLDWAVVHAVARVAVAAIWIWHGLVPKLIFHNADEQRMLLEAGLPLATMAWVGAAEVGFGLAMLALWRWRGMFWVSGLAMAGALIAVAVRSTEYLTMAFNPVTLNGAMIALSLVGWVAAARVPTAARCLRRKPKEQG
jgi:hypothetical protein